MCVCICVCVCVCVCVCACVCVSESVCVCLKKRWQIRHGSRCVCVCVFARACVCVHVYMCIRVLERALTEKAWLKLTCFSILPQNRFFLDSPCSPILRRCASACARLRISRKMHRRNSTDGLLHVCMYVCVCVCVRVCVFPCVCVIRRRAALAQDP